MWFARKAPCAAAVLLILTLAACSSYTPVSEGPLVVPEGYRVLYLVEVENPTLETWLSQRLRSEIRDEVTNRGRMDWGDKHSAGAFLKVRIVLYTTSSRVKDPDDVTLKYQVTLAIEGSITLRGESGPHWTSGRIEVSESYLPGAKARADDKIVRLCAERLVDKMSQAF